MAYTKTDPRRSTRDRKKPDVYTSTTTTTSRRAGAGRPAGVTKTKKVTTTKGAATHHKRKPTIKDKIEGTVKKVEGALTKNPAKKAAGTKQKRGTDGKAKRGRPSLTKK